MDRRVHSATLYYSCSIVRKSIVGCKSIQILRLTTVTDRWAAFNKGQSVSRYHYLGLRPISVGDMDRVNRKSAFEHAQNV